MKRLLKHWIDDFYRRLAELLPNRLLYWATMRAGAMSSVRPWGDTDPTTLTIFQTLERVEERINWQTKTLSPVEMVDHCPHCLAPKLALMLGCPSCGGPYDSKPEPEMYVAIRSHTVSPTPDPFADLPGPTSEMLNDPAFEAIWQVIKAWDVRVPPDMRTGAMGNHARQMYEAVQPYMWTSEYKWSPTENRLD